MKHNSRSERWTKILPRQPYLNIIKTLSIQHVAVHDQLLIINGANDVANAKTAHQLKHVMITFSTRFYHYGDRMAYVDLIEEGVEREEKEEKRKMGWKKLCHSGDVLHFFGNEFPDLLKRSVLVTLLATYCFRRFIESKLFYYNTNDFIVVGVITAKCSTARYQYANKIAQIFPQEGKV